MAPQPKIACNSCDFKSASEHEDRIHVALSHGFSFKCNFCPKYYVHQSSVVSHILLAHLHSLEEEEEEQQLQQNTIQQEAELQVQQLLLQQQPLVVQEFQAEQQDPQPEQEQDLGQQQDQDQQQQQQQEDGQQSNDLEPVKKEEIVAGEEIGKVEQAQQQQQQQQIHSVVVQVQTTGPPKKVAGIKGVGRGTLRRSGAGGYCLGSRIPAVTPNILKLASEPRDVSVQCRHCDKIISRRYYKAHLNAEHRKIRYPCTLCSQVFKYSGSLSRHLNSDHNAFKDLPTVENNAETGVRNKTLSSSNPYDPSSPFNCEPCQKTYLSKSALRNHIDTKHNSKAYKCPNCTRVFNLKFSLVKHLKNQVCGSSEVKLPETSVPMKITKATEENEDPALENAMDEPLEVLKGGATGQEEDEFDQEPMVVDKTQDCFLQKCEFCEVMVTNRKEKFVHYRASHMDPDNPVKFKCPKCPKSFTTVHFLRIHFKNGKSHLEEMFEDGEFRITEEEKSVEQKCEFCDVMCPNRHERLKHLKELHTDQSDPPRYVCPKCPKLFRTVHLLRSHYRSSVHSTTKNYTCELCSKQFFAISNLTKHVNVVHHDIKNFKCPECDYRAASRKGIREHYEPVHLGRRDHVCPTCLQAFSKKGKLVIHQREHGH